jgi:hypothetical protein
MIEKDIYTIENLLRYVSNPFFFRDEEQPSVITPKEIMSKDEAHQLFKEANSDVIAKKLHDCYAKWIDEAGKMRGQRKIDTLNEVFLIFYELTNKYPFNYYLNIAISSNKVYFEEYRDELEAMLQAIETPQNEVIEPIKSPVSIEFKPIFKPDAIPQIFAILKDFFVLDEQPELKTLLESGGNVEKVLLFNGAGKTLLDTFKQLLSGQFLMVSSQKDLQKWLSKNFMYLDNKSNSKQLTAKYASTIISETNRAAKGNRLIDVTEKNGKFEIIQIRIVNREQNKR